MCESLPTPSTYLPRNLVHLNNSDEANEFREKGSFFLISFFNKFY